MTSFKDLLKISSIPVLVASLCCIAPVVLVLLGLSTVAAAVSLTDVLYGQYKWIFRGVGLALLIASLVFYFRRKKNICTLDQAKRQRNKIVNTSIAALIISIIGYGVVYYGLELFARVASNEY